MSASTFYAVFTLLTSALTIFLIDIYLQRPDPVVVRVRNETLNNKQLRIAAGSLPSTRSPSTSFTAGDGDHVKHAHDAVGSPHEPRRSGKPQERL